MEEYTGGTDSNKDGDEELYSFNPTNYVDPESNIFGPHSFSFSPQYSNNLNHAYPYQVPLMSNSNYAVMSGYDLYPGPNKSASYNSMAIASLVSALLGPISFIPVSILDNSFGFYTFYFPVLWLPIVGSILAVVFGKIGFYEIKLDGKRGKGLAIAGIVLGCVELAVIILLSLLLLFLLFAISRAFSGSG